MHFVFTPQLNLQVYIFGAKTQIQGLMHSEDYSCKLSCGVKTKCITRILSFSSVFLFGAKYVELWVVGSENEVHHKNPFFQSKHRSRDLCVARILGINLLLLHSRITPLTIPSPQMRPKGRSSRGLCIARILGTHFALTHTQLTNPHLWRQNLKLWDLWRRFSGSTSFALTNNSAHNSESTNAAKTQIEGFVRGFARSVDVWDPFYFHSYTTQLTIPQIWRQNSESGGVCV